MATTAAAICPGCGYENNAKYKFCGMCGTALHGVMPASKGTEPKPAPLSVGGLSILGLSQDAPPAPARPEPPAYVATRQQTPPEVARPAIRREVRSEYTPPVDRQPDEGFHPSLDYLFEDEEKKPKSPRGRLYLALALLLVTAGGLLYQYERNGYPWDDLSFLSAENIGTAVTGKTQPSQPASQADSSSGAAKPAAGVVPEPQAAPAPKAEEAKPVDAPVKPAPAAAVETPEFPAPAPKAQKLDTSLQQTSDGAAASDSGDAAAGDQDAPAAENPATPASAAASGETPTEAATPAEAVELLMDGTKYLLGNGVAQNCEKAQRELRAATRFSSEAESMLGTMYASGHCVTRDLPTSYRWYARALHSKPDNTRIQNDLTVLWNQMTPAERQAATHSAPQ